MKQSFILFFLLIITGCATKGFNRGSLQSQLGTLQPEATDAEISKVLSKKPNLPKSFKLAVYFSKPQHQNPYQRNWRWTQKDKNILLGHVKTLKNQKILSSIIPIIPSMVQTEDIKNLRLVAAQHGADALLIVRGIADVQRNLNEWTWTYSFILPAFFINGSEVDSLFMANASLWDVRNGYLYLTAEGESTYNESYPAVFGQTNKELITKVKTTALNRLNDNFIQMVEGRTSNEEKYAKFKGI